MLTHRGKSHIKKIVFTITRNIGGSSLYRPEYERDSCGVGFIAQLQGKPSRDVVENATSMLSRMAHRGGCGCEKNTGDGAGMLLSLPHYFLRQVARDDLALSLPPNGSYGVGMVFLPVDPYHARECKNVLENVTNESGLKILGWRKVPTDNSTLGTIARLSEPDIEQVFVAPLTAQNMDHPAEHDRFDTELYRLRKLATNQIETRGIEDFYICSLSCRTMTYKGQLTPDQLREYYIDLRSPDFASHMAMVHSRFSTNTFPSWARAQPNRMLCHNGEINTLRGNKNWMYARSRLMLSPLLEANKQDALLPICSDAMTDSGNFDSVLELLTRASERTIAESMMMLIPEAWQNNAAMDENKRAFYKYNSCVMEPWDGPAMMAFTDGRYLGACLDRNGLRPSRFYVTNDDLVILSSEVGVLPNIDQTSIKRRGRLEPGKMFLVDFERGGIIHDDELKQSIASARDYCSWIEKQLMKLEDYVYKDSFTPKEFSDEELRRHLNMFGYTNETLELLLMPMAGSGKEALGSMGIDIPLAVLSELPKSVPDYFKQLFAQVTNPPIDPIREEIVMSLQCPVGPESNLLKVSENHARRLILESPVLMEDELECLKAGIIKDWESVVVDAIFSPEEGDLGLQNTIDKICKNTEEHVKDGAKIVILSHKKAGRFAAPIPSLLLTGAVHHHLINERLRTQVALLVEAGDAKEVHEFCTLGGKLHTPAGDHVSLDQSLKNYKKAIEKGILKVMAKMGISTLQSYKGAQIFEAVGLKQEVIDKCFGGTTSRIEGAGFSALAHDIISLHSLGYPERDSSITYLRNPGEYHYRHGGEEHLNDPRSMSELQISVRNGDPSAWKRYSEYSAEQNSKVTLRGLLGIKIDPTKSISIDEVEPTSEIVKRFVTGAMSLGSISAEAHEALAIAMNRIGGKSNTGEGGEDPMRFIELPTGDSKRSAIKQVASGRFGVTAEYLANADQIQIKMAQGAKPGEGGELPGYKVTEEIAHVRGTTPGVGLISPPPHHDIYSIEDLAQLIYDLKNAVSSNNPDGTVSVKLVSEVGVGIVAAGVAKAKADHITISGGDGGTGAAAWTGIHRAGLPWELGIAETQQTLVVNNLRSRVRLQVDGQIKTGRDVIIAGILGAEEFGFSTAPLIALGCIMMRKCHLNTCPVGIATQDPVLRKKFVGQPEHVQNYFLLLADEVRQYMAALGVRRFDDLIGTVEHLHIREELLHYKSKGLDLSPLLVAGRELNPNAVSRNTEKQDHGLDDILDNFLIEQSKPALEHGNNVNIELNIGNINRALGAKLSSRVAKSYGSRGLPDNSIHLKLKGSGGQSLGFILAKGITMELEGDANDYVGKSLCGGKIIVYPNRECFENGFKPEENVIIGNVALYGATSGEAYFRGKAGERFCVRNSGAHAVVEGIGDHGCEYMTGGRVVVLGSTGRNFAAGMSGGIAYVYDAMGDFHSKVNHEMVKLEPVDTDREVEELLSLIEKHRRYTASSVASEIMRDWKHSLPKFVKVMPNDYKRVLEELESKIELDMELRAAL